MTLKSEIVETIRSAIPDAQVEILDPMHDGIHLEAIVVSESFEGLTRIKRHQLVMTALTDHFATTLHALALKTYTPDQWRKMHE